MWDSALPALLGAVVGSLTAGLISWWLQRQNLREARKMREEERLERDKALGMSVFLKMGHIHMVFEYMKFHFEKGMNLAKAADDTDFCKYVTSLNSMLVHEQFTYEELGLVFSFENDDLFQIIFNMNSRQVVLLDSVSVFNVKRAELNEIAQSFPVGSVEGMSIEVTIPDESKLRFEFQKNIVNGFIKSTHSLAEKGAEDARKALNDLEKMLNSVLELGVRFEETDSQTSEETPQQNSG